jgi:mRNA-degrading endonuclease RelE of RelBE toxin-antitoxin system
MNAPDTYRVIFSPASWKNLMKFPEKLQDSILDKIYTLEEDPRPSG